GGGLALRTLLRRRRPQLDPDHSRHNPVGAEERAPGDPLRWHTDSRLLLRGGRRRRVHAACAGAARAARVARRGVQLLQRTAGRRAHAHEEDSRAHEVAARARRARRGPQRDPAPVAQRGEGTPRARLGTAVHARRRTRAHDRLVQRLLLTGVLDQDLEAVLDRTRSIWTELDGARLLLTGATGFVGTHMLESVRHARARTGADVRVVAPARNPESLRARLPWTKNASWLEVVQGDIHRFALPPGAIDLAIHSANTASPGEIADDPKGISRMVVEGSARVYALASAGGARRMLQLSSGSVCGAHFTPSKPITEDDSGEPQFLGDGPADRLARAKREAEQALLLAAGQPGAPVIVFARGFALCGPWLPLDSAFAFGNFLGAAMRGRPVIVNGDGT